MTRVAVILVDYNAGEVLPRALRCLDAQTRRADRVIVVDNDSSDGSAEAVERDFEDVEVLRMGRNAGFAAGNNAGVAVVDDCDWVALLNTDAYAHPGWLEALIDAAEAHPEASSFASRMMRADHPGELDGSGDVFHVSGFCWRRHFGRRLEDEPEAGRPAEVFGACAGAALYRRDAFREVGGFDERFFCYLEDVDLSFRLQLAGHRCRYVPDSVVDHVGSATAGYESEFTVYHSHRNMVWAWVKNMPGPLALLYAPMHIAANLASVAWFARRGLGGVVWRAKRDALRELGRVLRERRAVQSRRRASVWQVRRRMAGGLSVYHATEARHVVDRFRDRLLTRVAAL